MWRRGISIFLWCELGDVPGQSTLVELDTGLEAVDVAKPYK